MAKKGRWQKGHKRRKSRYKRAPQASSSCSRKKRFRTEGEAQEAVDTLQGARVYINGLSVRGELQVYFCYRCGSFHLGHSRPLQQSDAE